MKRGEVYFGSQLQKAQFRVGWLKGRNGTEEGPGKGHQLVLGDQETEGVEEPGKHNTPFWDTWTVSGFSASAS